MSLSLKSKKEVIAEFAKDNKDSGSTQVQCALMTKRIEELTNHLKAHKKDFASRRSLLILVGKRRSLLNYLKNSSSTEYEDLIKNLNIRK
jgi:small subunit ribosomal protein S15